MKRIVVVGGGAAGIGAAGAAKQTDRSADVRVYTDSEEAPRKEQQAWFIRRFGPDVNLGNISPDDVLGPETLRLGLRADTIARLR